MITPSSWSSLGEKSTITHPKVFISWWPEGSFKECKVLYVRKDSIQIETPNGGVMDVGKLDAIRIND